MESLDSATTNKSLLVIAHRLSTIVNSDKIIVIQDGKSVEEGTHDELLALNGQYKIMWDTQTKQLDKPRDDREKVSFWRLIFGGQEKIQNLIWLGFSRDPRIFLTWKP